MFLYSVLAGLDQRNHPQPNQVKNYINMFDMVNLNNITFPVTLGQISQFEKITYP